MGNQDSRGQQQKPAQALATQAQITELKQRLSDTEKRVQELEKVVNDKNQWNNTVREWVGTEVVIHLSTGSTVTGVLENLDRYTLYVTGRLTSIYSDDLTEPSKELIVHKGAIVLLFKK